MQTSMQTSKRLLPTLVAALSCSLAQANDKPMEQVIVYGEKQEKNLQDTAVSVSVMTAEQLERAPIFDLQDVFSRTANVAARNPGDQRTDFTIRGVRVDGITDDTSGYTASVYVDGAILNNDALNFGGLGVWDLSQVEVFRGPQGTLFGRNTLMGAIVAQTKDPTFEQDGHAQVQLGEYNTQRYSFAYGNAIIDDVLAFRLSVDQYKTDGVIDNVTTGSDDHAYTDRQEVRSKLLWTPSDALRVKLTASYMDNDVGAPNSVRDDDPFSYEAASDIQDSNVTKNKMGILNISYDINETLSFTSITSYSDDQFDRYDDYDSGPASGNYIGQTNAGKGWTQELRFNYQREDFSAVAGVYASETERAIDYYVESLFPTSVFRDTAAQAYQSLFGLPSTFAYFLYDTYMPASIAVQYLTDGATETKNTAVFGEASWDVNQWSFTAGLRYDKEKLDRVDFTDTTAFHGDELDGSTDILPPFGITQEFLVTQTIGFLASSSPKTTTDADYDAILPKAVISYHWNDDLTTSFLMQRGYRAGGAVVNLASAETIEYDPEHTWNYELSLRSQWLDKRLTVNANLYHIDWEDQQVSVSASGGRFDTYTDNAGESELQGLEVEFSFSMTEDTEIFGSVGYSNTEFKQFTVVIDGALEDLAGNEFKQAPRYSGNLGINQRFGDFATRLEAAFQDGVYTDNENSLETDSFVVLNARVDYQLDEVWRISAWATNLLDREYETSAFTRNPVYPGAQDLVSVGSPRILGAGINFRF